MSKRTLGIVPRSGEAMLKDAIGQFKSIISQIKEGVKKVQSKVSKNTTEVVKVQEKAIKKVSRLETENVMLSVAMQEAVIVCSNLETMLNGKIATIEPTDEVKDAVEATVDEDKAGDTPSD